MKRALVVSVALAAYAWVVTGVAPFSLASYLLIALPAAAFVAAYVALGGLSPSRPTVSTFYRRLSAGVRLPALIPWITLLATAVILEAIGLALGGRSTVVPTLSTAVDHLLDYHWERCVLCWTWLIVGVVPIIRLRELTHEAGS